MRQTFYQQSLELAVEMDIISYKREGGRELLNDKLTHADSVLGGGLPCCTALTVRGTAVPFTAGCHATTVGVSRPWS